jgi:effector-binding domain-containing protein
MIETPRIVDTPAQQVAALHIATPREAMQRVMGPAIGEAMAAAKDQGLDPTGPWFAHHHAITTASFDFDVCVPVSAPIAASGRVRAWQRPALTVASTVYHGPYEGLGDAWHAFGEWLDANGHKTATDLYECYLVGPADSADPAAWRTELTRPIVAA